MMTAANAHPFLSGNHLRAARTLAGLQQAELAAAAKVSSRALRHWEAVATMPSHGVALARFAAAIESHGVRVTSTGCELRLAKAEGSLR